MYDRAELISRTCASANQKLAKKRESKTNFIPLKLPGIIADAKSRAPPKFRATAPLRIIFYIEEHRRYTGMYRARKLFGDFANRLFAIGGASG